MIKTITTQVAFDFSHKHIELAAQRLWDDGIEVSRENIIRKCNAIAYLHGIFYTSDMAYRSLAVTESTIDICKELFPELYKTEE